MKQHLISLLLATLFVPQLIAQNIPKAGDYPEAAEFEQRRAALRQLMPKNSVAVLFANPVRNRANDVDYVYHPDPNFYYLSGYREPHGVLLVYSEIQQDAEGVYDEILYVQNRDPSAEMWNGKRLGVEGAKKLGVDRAIVNEKFAEANHNFGKFDKVLFFPLPNDVRDNKRNNADLYNLLQDFGTQAAIPADFVAERGQAYEMIRAADAENSANVAQYLGRMQRQVPELKEDKLIIDFIGAETDKKRQAVVKKLPENRLDGSSLSTMMGQLREVKSEKELDLLRKAVYISTMAQREVMKAMKPSMSEMEVQGLHEYVYKKYQAEAEGYPSIVGAGHNGCVLHYIENDRPTLENTLVLMDLGAQYRGYTADVTRTIPANGKFSPEQKAIYQLVLKAQNAAIDRCKPGTPFWEMGQVAKEIIDEGLIELGITKAGEKHNYFPHGTSHYIGLDVHDPGTYGPLRAGSVITVEPGIYIPENSPCDSKWWGIAVRIEDDILITEEGWENLSRFAPREVDEIEALMAQPSPLDSFKVPALEKAVEQGK
jgi:Xaa-Pro aminopeptidase